LERQPHRTSSSDENDQLDHDIMFALRRKAVQTAGRLPAATSTVSRLYSTGQHGKTGDEVHHFAGSSQEHGEHHAGPENESLGVSGQTILPNSKLMLLRRPVSLSSSPRSHSV
jgi:hypothetical protein